MKITLQTRLLPDAETAAKLRATVERFNEAADWLAGVAFGRKLANKFALQRLAYAELRERFALPGDTAIRCISQVCEAYKRDRSIKPKFRQHAAVPYSMGKNIGFKGPDRVSISTLDGRVIVPFLMGKYQAERFGWPKGQCDLVLRRDGKWFLLVTVDVPDGTPVPPSDFIGVDMGVVNIAVDSDGTFRSSEAVEAKRVKYTKRRQRLGKETKGASRKKCRACHKAMARSERKESRFRRDLNHCISKALVARAKDTGQGIAIEDLEGIRDGQQFRRQQRARMGGWAFFQLRALIEYKARLAGVFVAVVDPAYSSQTCNACGHCERANRTSQSEFQCRACGRCAHADLNSALNLRDRARVAVNRPCGTGTRAGNGPQVQVRSPSL
jgi:IS605 OrfB family transposase